MNIILLSGGSGKRLWPLSNDAMSKQFLKVLKDENENDQSMVQRVFSQLEAVGLAGSVTVAAGRSQLDSIQSQIADRADIVIEPERRNTFPAIALSCAYLVDEKHISREEVVIVLPVDPYAEQGYFTLLREMEQAVRSGAGEIVLMGVRPAYPSAKYGYIIPEATPDFPKKVSCFKEKPTEDEATCLIGDGALWNCGVFAFKLGYIMDLLSEHISVSSFGELYDRYGELPKESFDIEVLENASSAAVIAYDGVWKDLGTWNTLTEQMESPALGKNILLDETCENTHVINVLDIPVIVMGAKGMVVVASHDGVLVADKHQSSYLKPLADRVSGRPRFEARRWGNVRVIDHTARADQMHSMTRRMHITAGCSVSYHCHKKRAEVWTVTAGEGEFLLDGQRRPVSPGDALRIPAGCRHAVRAFTDMEIIEVQLGGELAEEDKACFEMEW